MRIEQAKEIANAVLYEGYLLYPYRHSAIKNRQRWNFGVVYPREYAEAQGGRESWTMHTECLIAGQEGKVDVHVRFLQLLTCRRVQNGSGDRENARSAQERIEPVGAWNMVDEPWEEGRAREVSVLTLSLPELVANPRRVEIAFPGERLVERDHNDPSTAEIAREQHPLTGAVFIAAEPVGKDLYKISVHIENRTPGTAGITNHSDAALHSYISTHTLLQTQQGRFISLLEPPEPLEALAQSCQNLHTWPVLLGDEGERDMMLSSPIILYDYPQLAPESPGSLFDGTEIDELLSLRILTLTDEEKQAMRQGDVRAREILERTEAITPEQFMKLHGVIRRLRTIDEGGAR